MNSKNLVRNILVILCGGATKAFAAGPREDHSGILVWAFLGFCGLIVAAQLVPAVLVLLGIAKGVVPQQKAAHQTADANSAG